ncbi:MAG: hypothetical protein ACP5VP_01195 [Candidatus Limnocylindrales bacterium]
MDGATLIIVLLALLLLGGYAVGGMLNARRMQTLAGALRTALAGPRGSARVRRLGRNLVRIEVERPVPGTGPVAATVLLAPRESLLAWLFWILQGRGDQLDIRVELDSPPVGAGLLADPRHPTGRAALSAAVAAGGTRRDGAAGGLAVAAYDAEGMTAMTRLAAAAADVGDLVLLELRGAQPRLTLLLSLRHASASLPGLRTTLQQLVGQVSRKR